MTISFNVTGSERKHLVETIAGSTGVKEIRIPGSVTAMDWNGGTEGVFSWSGIERAVFETGMTFVGANAHSAEFQKPEWFAVDAESFRRAEYDVTDTVSAGILIREHAVVEQFQPHGVKIWVPRAPLVVQALDFIPFSVEETDPGSDLGWIQRLVCQDTAELRGIHGVLAVEVQGIRLQHHRTGLVQPYVAVYSGTFVVPAFLRGGIAPHCDHVVPTVVDVRGQVVEEGRISTPFMTQIEPVAEYLAVPEYTFEFDPDLLPLVLRRDRQMLPVPSDGIPGIIPADAFVPVGVAGFSAVGQVHHPVVREAYLLPGGIVEGWIGRRLAVSGSGSLGEMGEIFGAVAEISHHGRSVT